jgi:hypothetical protein
MLYDLLTVAILPLVHYNIVIIMIIKEGTDA